MAQALPYLKFRTLSFVPSMIATIGFATYRGKLDTVTPLKISVATQLLNVILDPILIFKAQLETNDHSRLNVHTQTRVHR